MRRHHSPFNGKKYIGNTSTHEVHDLDNEEIGCRINLIKDEHVKTFMPDSKSKAKRENFHSCMHCMGRPKY